MADFSLVVQFCVAFELVIVGLHFAFSLHEVDPWVAEEIVYI